MGGPPLTLLLEQNLRYQNAPGGAKSEKLSDEKGLLTLIKLCREGKPLVSAKSFARVYTTKNSLSSVKGFGSQFRGQEEAGRMLAGYVDEKYKLFQSELTKGKKDFVQPVCAHGVGCGKSALLSHGLDLHKMHCRNKDVLELLKDESFPLAIHITFNSHTCFMRRQEKDNIQLALIRRVLAACLGLNWSEILTFPLSNHLTLLQCLDALLAYHKEVHRIRDDQKVFVYLGIDEVNELVHEIYDEKPDISSLKGVAGAMQGLFPRHGFVSTLLAGTRYIAITESCLTSGIKPLYLPIARLPDETIETMLLNDAGVSPQYLEHPKFRALLRDMGPMMRCIGIVVSQLEHVYDEGSISRAMAAALMFFRTSKKGVLASAEIKALISLALTGQPVTASKSLSSPEFKGLFSVAMARMTFEILVDDYLDSDGYLVEASRRLLGFVDTHGPDSFEKFVAHYHGVKKAVLLSQASGGTAAAVPISSFFLGALIGDDLLNMELQLSPVSVPLNFPDGVMWLQGSRYPDVAEQDEMTKHLHHGGVLLNAKGGTSDALVCENIREKNTLQWHRNIIVFAPKHVTVGGSELTLENVTADFNKVVNVFKASKNHSSDPIVLVHFSNRELSKEVLDAVTSKKAELKRSVVVGWGNIESVFGPMFGRMLMNRGLYYTAGKANDGSGRLFSTLVPTTGSCVPRRVALSLSFLRRLL
eukprot:gene24760-29920_t